MFNPLALLKPTTLDGFTQEGYQFFVRQTFPRGIAPFEKGIKACFLLCHYREYREAKEHYDALAGDNGRFLYEWENPEHQEKLKIAASQPFGYRVFTNTFMENWERHITKQMRQKIKGYVQQLGWKPGRDDTVDIDFYPHFGVPHITLRFQKQKVQVNFEEIENRS